MAGFVRLRPRQIWGWGLQDVTYDESREPIEAADLAAAFEREFAWLTEFGFSAASCEHSSLLPDSPYGWPIIVCPYRRDDATLVVVAWGETSGWTIAALVGPPVDGNADTIERAWNAQRQRVAQLGTVPVIKRDLDTCVRRLANWLRDNATDHFGGALALDTLRHQFVVAHEQKARSVETDRLRRAAAAYWEAGGRLSTAKALNELAMIATLSEDEQAIAAEIRDTVDDRSAEPHERWRSRMRTVRQKDRLASLAWAYREHERPEPQSVTEARRVVDTVMATIELDLGEIERGLRDLDAAWVDPALTFLEADLYFFGSGHRKDKLMRRLARMELTPEQRARACALLLRAVDAGTSGNSPDGWKLARRCASNALRRGLRERLNSADPLVARRALAMIARVRRPEFSELDVRKVRDLIESIAQTSEWGGPNWLRPLQKRFS
jgi:hypothetical protein